MTGRSTEQCIDTNTDERIPGLSTQREYDIGDIGAGDGATLAAEQCSVNTPITILSHTHTRALQICYIKCIHVIVSIVLSPRGKFCNKDQIYEIL